MEKIEIYYNEDTYDNIKNKIQENKSYNKTEKEQLILILDELEKQSYLLYAIEILDENKLAIEVKDFDKYKTYLIEEVYHEIYRQLLDKYKDYEEVSYVDIRKHFIGMTFDIEIINNIDALFKDCNITIRY